MHFMFFVLYIFIFYVDIDQWRRRNVHPYKSDFDEAKNRSIRAMGTGHAFLTST